MAKNKLGRREFTFTGRELEAISFECHSCACRLEIPSDSGPKGPDIITCGECGHTIAGAMSTWKAFAKLVREIGSNGDYVRFRLRLHQ